MSKRIELALEGDVPIAIIQASELINVPIINETVNELIEMARSQEHPKLVIDFEKLELLSTTLLGGLPRIKKAAGLVTASMAARVSVATRTIVSAAGTPLPATSPSTIAQRPSGSAILS